MLNYHTIWTSAYALNRYRGRALPYNRVTTTDEVALRFHQLCHRRRIEAEWFPYAGAISFNPNSADIKTINFLREEAIDMVDDSLLRSANLRIRQLQ